MVTDVPPIRVRCIECGPLVVHHLDILLRVEEGVYTTHFVCEGCGKHRRNAIQDPNIVALFRQYGIVARNVPLEVWERRHIVGEAPKLDLDDLIDMHVKLEAAPAATWVEREQL